MHSLKADIIDSLQEKILQLQGYEPPRIAQDRSIGLGPVEKIFPNGVFPRGMVHEFLAPAPEHAAATGGFIGGLLHTLMKEERTCLWISNSVAVFPPSLATFGVSPERIIFICLERDRDVLWAAEEALKCKGLAAVVAEVREMTFTQSRRLQLAVEQSRVTGLILRSSSQQPGPTACAARWKISPLPSDGKGLPGVGFPRWEVELQKVKNGGTGKWQLEWAIDQFSWEEKRPAALPERKAV